MDRSHKGLLLFQDSNSPTSSATPKPSLSGENNENDVKQDQMDSKSQNSKKHFHKHFMSSTVSTTSKAIVPRKKILAERNESAASVDVHFHKSPTREPISGLIDKGTSHCARSSSGASSASNSTSQFDDDGQNSSCADSSLKPYDPLTNYLSPRPQYLRYKPNRRRAILERQQCLDEKEGGSFLERSSSFESKNIVDEAKSSDCVQDSSIPPSRVGIATLHNQEAVRTEKDNGCDDNDDEEEEDEEVEEFEEEKRCNQKGVLKFLLLLVVIGLSTSYICSMNSSRRSPTQQSMGGLKDGCYRMLNHSLEVIPVNLSGRNDVMRCTQAGFSGVNQQSSYQEFGKVQMVVDDEQVVMESGDDIVRMLESLNAENSDICIIGFDKSDSILDHLLNVITAGSKDADSDQVDFGLPHWGVAEYTIVEVEMDMIDDSSDQNPGIKGAKTDVSAEQELNMVYQSGQVSRVQEKMEKLYSFGDYKGSSGSASGDEANELENNLEAREVEGIFTENAGEELKDTGAERAAGVTRVMEAEETHCMVEKDEEISAEKAGEKMVEARSRRPEILNDESSNSCLMDYNNDEGPEDNISEEGLKLMKARDMEFEPIYTVCVAFSVFAVLLASLVYIYPLRAIQAPSKASQPVKVHCEESKGKEKLIRVQPQVEVECLKKKVESTSVKPSTMFFSMEETRKELSFNQAPRAVLLAELMIGKVSSSIRSCGRESKIIEVEESIKAFSHEESPAHSVSPDQPPVLDTGSTDSPSSYGSFTAEKKILKKQGGRDGSVKILTTPVRRSSRLQKRSVTSP